jgi:hypothetical protein
VAKISVMPALDWIVTADSLFNNRFGIRSWTRSEERQSLFGTGASGSGSACSGKRSGPPVGLKTRFSSFPALACLLKMTGECL